jgi:lysozyme family protein
MIDRRTFNLVVAGAAVTAANGLGPWTNSALAQTTMTDRWREYGSIVEEASRLGLAPPRIGAGLRSFGAENAVPIFSDLVETLERSAEAESKKTDDIDKLIDRAAELLRSTIADDSTPSEGRFDAQELRTFGARKRPVLNNELRAEYERLFRTAKINRSKAAWYVNKLKDPDNQARYKTVAAKVCVPWFAVGIIHGMEAGFNFRGHLHNGDSLKRKTRNIPRNRPTVWNPPNSWELSAIDALQYDKLDNQEDWSLAATLYRWEAYNGFRSRTIHKINTPYLWSYSNHYSRGKYVADNKWDPNAVSKQCGAAVMLKVLVDEGIVTIPSA